MSVAEQQLVDCDTSKDQGCGGGLMDYAFGGLHSFCGSLFIMPAIVSVLQRCSSARFAPGQCRCADVCFIMHAEYIIKNGGLDTEKDYSYWSVGGMCNKLREGAGLLLHE